MDIDQSLNYNNYMEENTKKIAIIGGGIIGLYLAWKLEEKGYKVTVFEKKFRLGGKTCAGLVSTRIKKFINIDNSFVKNEIDSTVIHFSRKNIQLKLVPPHLVLKRDKVISKLAQFFQGEGGKIILGREVNNLAEVRSRFRWIIGCDGALSKVRRMMDLKEPCFYLGLQTIVEKRDFSHNAETWPIESGFFWKIPQGDSVNFGVLGAPVGLVERFRDFCSKQGIKVNNNIESALIPQGLILSKKENIFLCGDASGLTKPWSGGGIIWGLTEANILLDAFPDFKEYRSRVNKFFRWRMRRGRIATDLVYFIGTKLPFLFPSRISRDNDFPLF